MKTIDKNLALLRSREHEPNVRNKTFKKVFPYALKLAPGSDDQLVYYLKLTHTQGYAITMFQPPLQRPLQHGSRVRIKNQESMVSNLYNRPIKSIMLLMMPPKRTPISKHKTTQCTKSTKNAICMLSTKNVKIK